MRTRIPPLRADAPQAPRAQLVLHRPDAQRGVKPCRAVRILAVFAGVVVPASARRSKCLQRTVPSPMRPVPQPATPTAAPPRPRSARLAPNVVGLAPTSDQRPTPSAEEGPQEPLQGPFSRTAACFGRPPGSRAETYSAARTPN